MVDLKDRRLDDTFYALSSSARRDMLARLARRSYAVTELAQAYPMSLNGVSKHLKALERAGLIERTREGRVHRIALDARPLREVSVAIEHYRRFWESQLEALSDFLKNPNTHTKTNGDDTRADTD